MSEQQMEPVVRNILVGRWLSGNHLVVPDGGGWVAMVMTLKILAVIGCLADPCSLGGAGDDADGGGSSGGSPNVRLLRHRTRGEEARHCVARAGCNRFNLDV